MLSKLRILFLAAEADPFVKIGGLGDVAGSLPPALLSICPGPVRAGELEWDGLDIRLAIPYHGVIQRQALPLKRGDSFYIPGPQGEMKVEIFTTEVNGVSVYLIGGDGLPPDAPVYTPNAAVDGFKYTFFSLAALELARRLEWRPHLVHANDWHTAPALYALYYRRDQDPFFAKTARLLGVHNLPYLGVGAGPALQAFGLPPAVDSTLPSWAQDMPLPLGLFSADHIVTVSPTYAREILTPQFGSGLDAYLRSRLDSVSGILNGLDMQKWDPHTDTGLPERYDEDHLNRRQVNKAALQRELGLEVSSRHMLIGMITRMDPQKGVDLLPEALQMLASGLPWQAVILGTGDPHLEDAVRQLEDQFPCQVRAMIRFDLSLSRRIYGAADALLIPSRYEPCGLTQMIAMRYGCVPIGRETGGLRDTIYDYGRFEHSTGFLFSQPTPAALGTAISRAIQIFPDSSEWLGLQQRGMQADFSWARFAKQYLDLYLKLIQRRQHE